MVRGTALLWLDAPDEGVKTLEEAVVLAEGVVQGYSVDGIAADVLNNLLLIRSKPTEQTGLAESHRAKERDQRIPDRFFERSEREDRAR